MGRLLVELYRGIKQGESRRTVCAALVRFADLAHRIRCAQLCPLAGADASVSSSTSFSQLLKP